MVTVFLCPVICGAMGFAAITDFSIDILVDVLSPFLRSVEGPTLKIDGGGG